MGYTHYWTQRRDYTKAQWKEICEHVAAILKDVQHVQGIPLAFEYDQPTKQPQVDGDTIRFNGLGDDGHETFYITRKRQPLEDWQRPSHRGWGFCKTARKPYDLAVTAVLSYLSTIPDHVFEVSSDGNGCEWLEGVAEARRALPRFANQIDIPIDIRRGDRAVGSAGVCLFTKRFDVFTCRDGRGYVERLADGTAYCFPTHDELRKWVRAQANVLNPGQWSSKEEPKLARRQDVILGQLVDAATLLQRDRKPPAFARPKALAAVAAPMATEEDLWELCEA